MSLTSYRTAPSRGTNWRQLGANARDAKRAYPEASPLTSEWVSRAIAGCNAWRRPTLPCLKTQYHRRYLVSRPSSRWDRVGHRRYDHQAMKLVDAGLNRCTLQGEVVCFAKGVSGWRILPAKGQFRPVIDSADSQARSELLGLVSSTHYCASTPSLSTSWSMTVRRYLIFREASRLDAFSGYPVHA